VSILEEGWPARNHAIAVTWPDAHTPNNPNSIAVVGFLTVSSGSSGILSTTPDARAGRASCVLLGGAETAIAELGLGTVDVSGGGSGYLPCGAAFWQQEESAFGSPPGSLARALERDDELCVLRDYVYASNRVVSGVVTSVDEVDFPAMPAGLRLSYLAFEGWSYEPGAVLNPDSAVRDIFKVVTVATNRCEPEQPVDGTVKVLLHRGTLLRDGTESEVSHIAELTVGERIVGFANTIPYPETRSMLATSPMALFTIGDDRSAEGALWSRIERTLSTARDVVQTLRDEPSRHVKGILRSLADQEGPGRRMRATIAEAGGREEQAVFGTNVGESDFWGCVSTPWLVQPGDTVHCLRGEAREGGSFEPVLGARGLFRSDQGQLLFGRWPIGETP
jgi:hypothetical protein